MYARSSGVIILRGQLGTRQKFCTTVGNMVNGYAKLFGVGT